MRAHQASILTFLAICVRPTPAENSAAAMFALLQHRAPAGALAQPPSRAAPRPAAGASVVVCSSSTTPRCSRFQGTVSLSCSSLSAPAAAVAKMQQHQRARRSVRVLASSAAAPAKLKQPGTHLDQVLVLLRCCCGCVTLPSSLDCLLLFAVWFAQGSRPSQDRGACAANCNFQP